MTVPAQPAGPAAPTLRTARSPQPIDLAEALATGLDALGDGAVAMVSTPTDHLLGLAAGGRLTGPDGPLPLGGVFSLRLFTTAAELRWVQAAAGRGPAVLLSETTDPPAGWAVLATDPAGVLDGQYALWGRRFDPHPTNPAWCRAVEGRIGWLDLPAPCPAAPRPEAGVDGRYLALRYREYVARDEHGNAHVAEERLTGITIAAPEFPKGTP
jgi:CRISPR-associated protein (TIGR03984 family)